MASTIYTSSSWYYDRSSEVLFINEDTHKVGINNNAPQYELHVDGNVFATGYCNLPAFAMSNNIYPTANFGSNLSVWSSNIASYSSNNMVLNSTIVGVSNISTSNVNLNTLQRNGINVIGTDGKIDYTWLKNAPQFSNDNTLAIAGLLLGSLGILGLAGQQLLTNNGLGTLLQDDILKKLGGDENVEDYIPEGDDIFIHYNNITFSPLFTKRGKSEVGLNSNLYMSDRAKLCSITHDDLLPYDSGKTKRIVANPQYKVVYDFATDKLTCDEILSLYEINTQDITASNIITSNLTTDFNLITSNLTASNIITSNLTASNIIVSSTFDASQVKVGNFYITPSGVFVGNPSNPFTSFQVLDSVGNYKGSIAKSQINDLEALNLQNLADGVVSYNGFSSSTNPLFLEPFSFNMNSLFEVL